MKHKCKQCITWWCFTQHCTKPVWYHSNSMMEDFWDRGFFKPQYTVKRNQPKPRPSVLGVCYLWWNQIKSIWACRLSVGPRCSFRKHESGLHLSYVQVYRCHFVEQWDRFRSLLKHNINISCPYLQILKYCSCSSGCSLQGDFRHKSSFVIWADDDGHRAEWKTWHVRLRSIHTVWLWSCHTSCPELSAWQKPNYSSLPKVTRFHRTTICQTFPRVGTWKDLSTFIWAGLNSLAKLWSCYFTIIACFKQWSRWRKGNICSAR